METVLTETEQLIIDEMRGCLAKEFGITVVDNHITLRFGKDKPKSVTMKIIEIDDGNMLPCFNCGESFNKIELHETTVTIQHCVSEERSTKHLCYDCYCPQ